MPLRWCRHKLQPETGVKFAAIVRAAAYQACDRAPDPAHPWKRARTIRTFVDKSSGAFADWERQIVTTDFVADPQITTSVAPLWAMR
jgi:hypothetical protein